MGDRRGSFQIETGVVGVVRRYLPLFLQGPDKGFHPAVINYSSYFAFKSDCRAIAELST